MSRNKMYGLACCVMGLLCVNVILAGGLIIQVAPQMLVLSSPGGNFTIHSNTPYLSGGNDVSVWLDGQVLEIDSVFPDNTGMLVAQTDKEKAKLLVGEFDGKTTVLHVDVLMNGLTADAVITVKK